LHRALASLRTTDWVFVIGLLLTSFPSAIHPLILFSLLISIIAVWLVSPGAGLLGIPCTMAS
jgi:hypothetical protein